MRKRLFLIWFSVMMYLCAFSQIEKKTLVVYSITEFIDGYVIRAIDTVKVDTVSIVSAKVAFKGNRKFKKIVVGSSYGFEFTDLINTMSASALNGFVARIKTTIVWKPQDGIENAPVYSKDMKGLWIKK
jgi:hypothetical protein